MTASAGRQAPPWREPDASRRWAASTALALVLESAALAALAWFLSRPAPPPPPQPIEITLSRPKPAPKVVAPKPPPPKPKPPPPRPKPQPRPRPHPIVHPHPRPLPPPPQPRIQPPPAPLPSAQPAMPVAPPPPPPPPPRTPPPKPDTAALRLSFEALLREAIQDAVHYPESARLMRVEGRALVSFRFLDGRVNRVRIVRSSDVPALDQAALQAVRKAPYPPAPAALAGRAMSFVIWVRFHLSS